MIGAAVKVVRLRQRPWRVAIFEALMANCRKDASKWKLYAPTFNLPIDGPHYRLSALGPA